MRYKDFERFFVPYNSKKYDKKKKNKADPSDIQAMNALFTVLILNESAKEGLRQKLNEKLFFDWKLLFDYLDVDRDGELSHNEVT